MSSADSILIQALNGTIQPIIELQKLLSMNCKIESVHPAMLASDAEVNIVTVTVICPEGVRILLEHTGRKLVH